MPGMKKPTPAYKKKIAAAAKKDPSAFKPTLRPKPIKKRDR